MKKLLLAGLLFTSLPAYCQGIALPIDSISGKVAYSAVVQAPGATQSELYGRAAKWLAALPNNAADPRVADATSGTLSAQVPIAFAIQMPMLKMPVTLYRRVSVQVKDGRAKYDITDFVCQLYAPTAGQVTTPSKAQLKLTPLEEYLKKADWHNYTKDGQPRVIPAGFIQAAREQSEAEIKTLTSALQAKSDW